MASNLTAVQWLEEQIDYISIEELKTQIIIAKEMEKQQIIEARVKKPLQSEWDEAEQYYNETFNK
jgi:hypothetical protein